MSAPIAAGIMAAACQHSGFTKDQIKSPWRNGELVRVRHAVMYALTERTAWSFPHIGRHLNRDHSTVIHGRKKAMERMAVEPEYAQFAMALINAPEWIEPLGYVVMRHVPLTPPRVPEFLALPRVYAPLPLQSLDDDPVPEDDNDVRLRRMAAVVSDRMFLDRLNAARAA